MGTETYSLHLRYQVKPLYIVKLNNPQMGTETRLILQPFFLYPSLLN